MKPIVIYDDNCGACTAFGTWGHKVIALGYHSKSAKKLMRCQFGSDFGFALMLFTEKKVYWGSHAAAQVTKLAYSSGLGTIFKSVIHAIYPLVVALLNVILKRKTLPYAPKFNCKKLPDSGSMNLISKARTEFKVINSKLK